MTTKSEMNTIAKKELELILLFLKTDIEKGIITKDGIRIYDILRKKGWNARSYSSKRNHSEYSYECGYGGCYQKAILTKHFEVGYF